ncbi:MAG: prolyl oligopeptidase family serine peptidase [Rhodobacteraceae bacterium]|nr:prolyl oligopeptidase family serine peptidase [Paracoccaceae bacterium]
MKRRGVFACLLLFPLSFVAGGGAGAQASCGGVEDACPVAEGVYHIELPSGVEAPPAVMFLHGWGGSGAGQIKNRNLVESVLSQGYAFIAPTGQPRDRGRSGHRWNAYLTPDLRDDAAFLNDVADAAAEQHGLDRDRILLAGFSGGGMMTWRVACDAPEGFKAYAPIAGLFWRPLPELCVAPVRLLHTHGWVDPVVPIEGRSVAGGRLTQGDLFVGLDLMRRTNECMRDDPDAYEADGSFWRRSWTECASGSALEFALHPGGHKTPAGWSAMALDWFERFD